MRRIAAVMAFGLLAGCSSSPPAPASPASQPPPPVSAAPAPDPVPTPQSIADQCGARDMAYLVGRPKSDIPVPVDPAKRRVMCSSCPVTMDFNPQRLNIVFDAETGVITQVKCG